MTSPELPLPIEPVLPTLRQALATSTAAVLQAPPGAGKTTRVPLALLAEPWLAGARIVMLEPRRLAARAWQGGWRRCWGKKSAPRSGNESDTIPGLARAPGWRW